VDRRHVAALTVDGVATEVLQEMGPFYLGALRQNWALFFVFFCVFAEPVMFEGVWCHLHTLKPLCPRDICTRRKAHLQVRYTAGIAACRIAAGGEIDHPAHPVDVSWWTSAAGEFRPIGRGHVEWSLRL